MNFKEYKLEESAVASVALLGSLVIPTITAFMAVEMAPKKTKLVKAHLSRISAKLKSFGVRDEVEELKNDLKMKQAIRFGKGGEERALNILKRHMENRSPEEIEKLKKAFESVKQEIRALQEIDYNT